MTKRLLVLALILVTTLSLGPVPPTARAADQAYVTHYYVYYACVIGPQPVDTLMGEWVVDCSGNWDGWGWPPDYNCTYTIKVTEEACS